MRLRVAANRRSIDTLQQALSQRFVAGEGGCQRLDACRRARAIAFRLNLASELALQLRSRCQNSPLRQRCLGGLNGIQSNRDFRLRLAEITFRQGDLGQLPPRQREISLLTRFAGQLA